MDRYNYVLLILTVIIALLWFVVPAQAAIPVFPGAEGFGVYATGGRGGSVYHVTNLNDSGPGSFRDAVSQSNRIVVFDVGGVINITSELAFANNITVAGQTAPGGIAIYGDGISLSNRNNIIIRYTTFRQGIDSDDHDKALNITNGYNMILDHLTIGWGRYDNIGITDNSHDITIQNSISHEGIDDQRSGGIIDSSRNITLARNLFINNQTRNPKGKGDMQYINNVIYNWRYGGYIGGHSSAVWHEDLINNYFIAGPSSNSSFLDDFNSNDWVYNSGNYVDLDKIDDGNDRLPEGRLVTASDFTSRGATIVDSAYNKPAVAVYTLSALDAYKTIVTSAGNSLNRDAVDLRLIQQLQSLGSQGAIIATEATVGGQPPIVGGSAPLDSDHDGMPDAWETAHGLNPNSDDHNGDFDNDGYTNLEEYLTEMVPIPAPTMISWAGGDANRYEVITNWSIPWQPTLNDRVEINTGKATVAYIGQEAGTLYVGNAAGSTAGQVAVTGGRLTVAKNVYLGNASSARGSMNLTGGSTVVGDQIVLAAAASSTGNLTVGKGAYLQAKGLTVNSGSGRSTKVGVEVADGNNTLMHFTGASSLAGVMDVQVASGYRPREGDHFTIMISSDPNGVYFSGDFSSFSSNITTGLQSGLSAFDGNADGSVYDLVFRALTNGDASGDHKVNLIDLGVLSGHWNDTSGTMTWQNADFSGDGKVDLIDLGVLSGNWGWVMPSGAPGMPIPEPASTALLTLAAAALLRRQRTVI